MPSDETVSELNQLFGLGQAAPARKLRYGWPCPVAEQEMGDFRLVPLTSSSALAGEGWHMQHCVASYATQCATGLYQVFSIRDLLGRRLATLGLAFAASGWRVDQCLGFKNAEVLMQTAEWLHGNGEHQSPEEFPDLHYVAQEVTRILNQQRKSS